MGQYLARRVVQSIPLLFLISVSVFALLNVIPGGPMAAYEQNPNIRAEDLQRIEEQLGLHDPLHVRYVKWLGALLRGDWGYSLASKRPVLTEIGDRLPNTVYLMSIAFTMTLLVAIPVGIISAVRQYSAFDHVVTTVAFAGQSIPIFWFGLILIIVFHVTLRNPWTGAPLFPGGGIATIGEGFSILDRIHHLVLPVAMLTVFSMAQFTRFMRSSMLDVIGQDYVRTAQAKGLSGRRVITKHALKNAALPLVTIIALDLPIVFNGALFTETMFSWPGMGRLFFESALRVDYSLLMAIVMINAALIVLCNILADLAYATLDPRIRYG